MVPGTLLVAASILAVTQLPGAAERRPGQAVPAPAIDFTRDVLPIFQASCIECHGSDLDESRLRLDSLEAVWQGGMSGHAIIPGDAEASPLMRRLLGTDEPLMSFGGDPLPVEQVELVRRWIDESEFDAALTAASPASDGERHWAYVKPERPPLGPVDRVEWVRNPIDRLVLARLESEGLAPSPEASKETLIRRLSLDLTGLPPTIDELDEFLADESPDAYARVVDRLLDSPRYGERLARPWLDLARYADTHGYEKDNPRTIWPYRDWVIGALNDDMSFRQFTIEQLAGDMLPNATLAQRIATGFHRNTLLNQEGGVDDEEARFDTLVDRVNTTATVWLGSTLGCTQCHTHKFDPFSHRDYYQFLAFFDNAEYEIIELGQGEAWVVEPTLSLPTREQETEATALEAELEELRTRLQTLTPDLEADRVAWEGAIRRSESAWTTLEPDRVSSRGGATLEILEDGSVRAGGENPEADTYELTAVTAMRGITGVRLEVLEDPSLPLGGPGRDPDGNFFLSGFEVEAAPLDTPSLAGRIPFASAVANDWQNLYEVGRALNPEPGAGGWAIDATPADGSLARQAVFLPREPFGYGAGTRLTVRLGHIMRRAARNIGRFRVSVTAADDPLTSVRLSARLRPILDIPAAERTEEQADLLAEAHRSVTPLLQPVRDRIANLESRFAGLGIATTLLMREREGDAPASTLFRNRGSFMSPGDCVYASVPDVLHPFPGDLPRNRLGLAQWLTSNDNPLVARVTVNRLWEQLFGRGLVETSEDFGSQGARPSHPELLDWLAVEFMEQGWSMKTLLRTVVTSATYRQTSAVSPALVERDQYNLLLARGPRFRVEAEMVRDIALAASGLLSDRIGGPSVFPFQPEGIWNRPYSEQQWVISDSGNQYRRGIYTYLRRTAPYPSLLTFDAPSRELAVVRRIRTNTPLQALTILNAPVYFEAAQYLAWRMVDEAGAASSERIEHGFRLVLSRRPSDDELATVSRFHAQQLERFEADLRAARDVVGEFTPDDVTVPELAAWTLVSNVLLNLDEAITKE